MPRGQPDKIAFNNEIWTTLEKVNIVVNNAERPMDDSDHYGVTEFWTVPVDGEGDCEDYVLAKRKMLLLLLGAAVIGLAHNRGGQQPFCAPCRADRRHHPRRLCLDNAQDNILATEKVDYHWVERQDPASATGWRSLEPR